MSWAEAGEAQLHEPFCFRFCSFQEISDSHKIRRKSQEQKSEK
jgi:hypothetical protein